MRFWRRKLALLGLVLGVAVVLGLLSNVTDETFVTALGGAALALLVVFGTPWAFDGLPARKLPLQDGQDVHPGIPTVVTDDEPHWYTLPYGDSVLVHDLQEDSLVSHDPLRVPTRLTWPAGAALVESLGEPLGVRHASILEGNGDSEERS